MSDDWRKNPTPIFYFIGTSKGDVDLCISWDGRVGVPEHLARKGWHYVMMLWPTERPRD